MKMGLSVWSVPGEWTLEKTFREAKAAGFDGVEVALAEDGEINLNSTAEDIEKIKTLALEIGIELYSLSSGLYWTYNYTSNDEKNRQKAKEITKKQLEVASWLGCDTILVVPGAVGVDFIPDSEVVEYDAAYSRALDALKELAPYAQSHKVCIGVENVWNKFLLSPLEMRDFINNCGSDYIKAYFDVGNVILTGYPEHWIKVLGNQIKKVHFKDFRRAIGNISGFVDMLSGDVNYPAVVRALSEIGYDGWVTAEVGFSNDYPEASVRNVANAVKTIIGRK